jgi:hypothetical protein
MRSAAAVLDLSPGAGVVLDGTEWTAERREPHLGRDGPSPGGGDRIPQRRSAAAGIWRAEVRVRPGHDDADGRRRAKVAELGALDRQQAKLLGLDAVSLLTLIR